MSPNRRFVVVVMSGSIAVASLVAPAAAGASDPGPSPDGTGTQRSGAALDDVEFRTLDGSGNHETDPELGRSGGIYPRVAEAAYADGIGEMIEGVDPRWLSNRIFNDTNVNVFSEEGISHWGFVWGQFLDHTFGLVEPGEEKAPLAFDADDPLESFTNDLGTIDFTRSAAADGTGETSPREQVNTVSSYIDAWAVYGGTDERLDWLRDGQLDGDPTNNDATLMLTGDGYLPTADARGDSASAPEMQLMGRLMGEPDAAVIAGDQRTNENLGLTAVQTLFAREHNRIVAALPDDLDEETKFQIARRIVGAEQQYITYTEFLPAMGVRLAPYAGYDEDVDPSITDEFATVGYRGHSMIHGEFEPSADPDRFTREQLDAFEAAGIDVTLGDDDVELAVPLNVAFGNPSLVTDLGLGPVLTGLASESQYRNEQLIDNQLRSVLFQIPNPDAGGDLDGQELPDSFSGVNDLSALDVARERDHGMPSYNDMRVAYGLEPLHSFTELTGEATDEWPDDPLIDADDPLEDADIVDVVRLVDANGDEVDPQDENAVGIEMTQRTTVAARLRAIYGDVDAIDAFTGMMSERHVPGTELGALQLAMWRKQFAALRDGDRFFYGNDPVLDDVADAYGIDFRRSLADIIRDNTDVDPGDVPDDVFHVSTSSPNDETDVPADETDAPTSSPPDPPAPRQPAPPRPPRPPRPRPRARGG